MMQALWRFGWKLRYLRTAARALDRRVAVENALFDMAAGKRPLPTREECRALAMKLGCEDPR